MQQFLTPQIATQFCYKMRQRLSIMESPASAFSSQENINAASAQIGRPVILENKRRILKDAQGLQIHWKDGLESEELSLGLEVYNKRLEVQESTAWVRWRVYGEGVNPSRCCWWKNQCSQPSWDQNQQEPPIHILHKVSQNFSCVSIQKRCCVLFQRAHETVCNWASTWDNIDFRNF
jgi:hypothetical protein